MVHLVQISDKLPETFVQDWEPLIPSSEIERVARLRNPQDHRRAMTRSILTRLIVGKFLLMPAEQIVFGVSDFGKPFIVFPDSCLQFNLSHSGDEILWGFSWSAAIGVDIEILRPIGDTDLIVNRFMRSDERAQFQSVRPDQKAKAFLAWWTRKEACVKALGLGLSVPLQHIVVPICLESAHAPVVLPLSRQPWTLFGFNIDVRCVGACVVAGSATSILVERLGASDLVNSSAAR